MPGQISAADIVIYIYEAGGLPPAGERLPVCAADYARARGLDGGGFAACVSAGGKPCFPARPDVHFSVSHSGGYWLAAFHGATIGLDIQAHVQRNYLAIAKRWFHADEYAAVAERGLGCFFDIWSAKESYCKMLGTGINADFNRFSVVAGGAVASVCNNCQLRQVSLFDGYSLCAAAQEISEIHTCDYSGTPGCASPTDRLL